MIDRFNKLTTGKRMWEAKMEGKENGTPKETATWLNRNYTVQSSVIPTKAGIQ